MPTNGSSSRFDFAKIAEHYDRWYETRRGSVFDRLEKRAIDRLLPEANKGARVLDVGCGTGHWSAHFAGKGFEVTGIDISDAMLRVARKKRMAGSSFRAADAENLPFADNQFDVAAAITVLEFTAHPERILSEMARCVKKPKGTLLVGALNAASPCNQVKKACPGSVYASADFLSPHAVEDLMSRFGKVDIRIAGFVPRTDWLLALSPLAEYLCRVLRSEKGAFIGARVRL